MNLKAYTEIEFAEPTLVPGAASDAKKIREVFSRKVAGKRIDGLEQSQEKFKKKDYLVFAKSFGRFDGAAYAFRIEPYGAEDLLIETRLFQRSPGGILKARAKGFGGVAGNIFKGFVGPGGRSLNDEMELFGHIKQAVAGGDQGILEGEAQRESQMLLKFLFTALEESIEEVT